MTDLDKEEPLLNRDLVMAGSGLQIKKKMSFRAKSHLNG
jgi:hypothetical protein